MVHMIQQPVHPDADVNKNMDNIIIAYAQHNLVSIIKVSCNLKFYSNVFNELLFNQ